MADAVIVDGTRTPWVRAGGPLRFTSARELGRLVARESLDRLDLQPADVDEVIAGNIATPADATNIARVIALDAGIPNDRIAHTVNRNCASGIESVTEAVERIRAGRAKTILALGVESMSNIRLLFSERFSERMLQLAKAKGRFRKLRAVARFRPSDLKPEFALRTGLTDPVSGLSMGETAEKLAREFVISRADQDSYALASHRKAVEAWDAGRLGAEVMPVYPTPRFEPIEQDIGPRAGQTIEALARLKPYFDRKYGTVTVGNSCQVTDGAAALLVMEEGTAQTLGLQPLGRIVDYAYAGCDPARMGLGPVYATCRVLAATGMTLADLDLIELNEAFAAQVLACADAFESTQFAETRLGRPKPLGELPMDRLNVNGGAIALGHPVGATGTRMLLTLLRELRRRGAKRGLATLCVGGGQGAAVIVEAM